MNEGSIAVIAEAARRADLDVKIIVFEHVSGFLDFDSIIAEPDFDEIARFTCAPVESSEEIAMILFSSGTTGPSKGVPLSHKTMQHQMRQSEALGIAGNVCLNFAAPDWITSIQSVFMNIVLNTRRFISPPFEDYSMCALIEKHKVTIVVNLDSGNERRFMYYFIS